MARLCIFKQILLWFARYCAKPRPIAEMTKTVNETMVRVNEMVPFRITLRNNGNLPLTDVRFWDRVPQGLLFIEGTVSVGGADFPDANPDEGFGIPDIPGSNEVEIYFLTTAYRARESAVNTAEARYRRAGGKKVADIKSNEVHMVIIQDQLADLWLIITTLTELATPGEEIVYRLAMKNEGPCPAENVKVLADVSDNLLNPEFSTDGGETYNPWQGYRTIGTLEQFAWTSFYIRGTVDPETAAPVSINAEIKSSTPDPEPENNRAEMETEIKLI